MYLKRHALQLLVAKRSVRQWISKAKRVHYNKYHGFHSLSGLCLFLSPCILSDSPCAELELDSIIITQLTSKRDLDNRLYDFIMLSRQWNVQISGNQAIKNRGYQAVHHTARLFLGFTLIKWVQMENGLWTKTKVYLQSHRTFALFVILSFILSNLPETSQHLKAFSSNAPRHLTTHYSVHTHAGLLSIVTIIKIGRVSQQMFLFGSLGCLLQTTGPCVSCVNG